MPSVTCALSNKPCFLRVPQSTPDAPRRRPAQLRDGVGRKPVQQHSSGHRCLSLAIWHTGFGPSGFYNTRFSSCPAAEMSKVHHCCNACSWGQKKTYRPRLPTSSSGAISLPAVLTQRGAGVKWQACGSVPYPPVFERQTWTCSLRGSRPSCCAGRRRAAGVRSTLLYLRPQKTSTCQDDEHPPNSVERRPASARNHEIAPDCACMTRPRSFSEERGRILRGRSPRQ